MRFVKHQQPIVAIADSNYSNEELGLKRMRINVC